VFGIGPQELIIVALLILVVFGPHKASGLAREVGRFVSEARRPVEEFKTELAAAGDDLNEPGNGENGARKRTDGSKTPGKGEITPEDVRALAE
jgi:Sec-independent protein translocase protein TatA